MLQPLGGVADPNRLVTVESVTPGGEFVPNSYPDFIDFRARLKQLDGIAVTHPVAFSVGIEPDALCPVDPLRPATGPATGREACPTQLI